MNFSQLYENALKESPNKYRAAFSALSIMTEGKCKEWKKDKLKEALKRLVMVHEVRGSLNVNEENLNETKNSDVIEKFVSFDFPKSQDDMSNYGYGSRSRFKDSWGTRNLKITKADGGWALVNYSTPIAYIPDDQSVIYIDSAKYSVTTSKIQNVLKAEASYEFSDDQIKMVDPNEMGRISGIRRGRKFTGEGLNERSEDFNVGDKVILIYQRSFGDPQAKRVDDGSMGTIVDTDNNSYSVESDESGRTYHVNKDGEGKWRISKARRGRKFTGEGINEEDYDNTHGWEDSNEKNRAKYYIETYYTKNGKLVQQLGSDGTTVAHSRVTDGDIESHHNRISKLSNIKPHLRGDVEYRVVNRNGKVLKTVNNRVGESIGESENPCWKGYKQLGMKTKNGKKVPNCIKESKDGTQVDAGNLVDYIMDYESGNLDTEGVLNLFSHLIKSGRAWTLQGSYGRTAQSLIDGGYIDDSGEINWEAVDQAMMGEIVSHRSKQKIAESMRNKLSENLKRLYNTDHNLQRAIREEYNGWKNRETWNVSLWINNDEGLYRSAVDFMQNYTGGNPYRDFIQSIGLANAKTQDRVQYLSNKLDYQALDDMMREME